MFNDYKYRKTQGIYLEVIFSFVALVLFWATLMGFLVIMGA